MKKIIKEVVLETTESNEDGVIKTGVRFFWFSVHRNVKGSLKTRKDRHELEWWTLGG